MPVFDTFALEKVAVLGFEFPITVLSIVELVIVVFCIVVFITGILEPSLLIVPIVEELILKSISVF